MIGQLATLYSPGMPSRKPQATVPTSLSTSHTLRIHSNLLDLQKGKCMRKELKSSDLCLRLQICRPNIRRKRRPNIGSILSTFVTNYQRVKLSFFQPSLLARGFSTRILLFGQMELDPRQNTLRVYKN